MLNTQDEIEARKAVDTVVEFILGNPTTDSAGALARVLLHAYNHYEQPLDITDLCPLDPELEEAGWRILRARVRGIEPHLLAGDKPAFERIVCARHGHDFMGCKSPVHFPGRSRYDTFKKY